MARAAHSPLEESHPSLVERRLGTPESAGPERLVDQADHESRIPGPLCGDPDDHEPHLCEVVVPVDVAVPLAPVAPVLVALVLDEHPNSR